jgi:hypothetical protein
MSEPAQNAGTAKWISIVIMAIGAVLMLAGALTYATVSSTLADERIVVADDATCLAGQPVAGPFAAFCQAEVIARQALTATEGRAYAEVGCDDPLRQDVMMASFLRASLFTSIVAFGIALMAVGIGLGFLLIGVALLDISGRFSATRAP